jgi:hypothetical protein
MPPTLSEAIREAYYCLQVWVLAEDRLKTGGSILANAN